jgi:hypothetical protein
MLNGKGWMLTVEIRWVDRAPFVLYLYISNLQAVKRAGESVETPFHACLSMTGTGIMPQKVSGEQQ